MIVNHTPREQLETALQEFRSLFEEPSTPPQRLFSPIIRLRRLLTTFEKSLFETLNGVTHPMKFTCFHCGKDYHEDYRVYDRIWHSVLPPKSPDATIPRVGGYYLHLACLEARLGRRVIVDDLTLAPCNDAIRYFVESSEIETRAAG